ncbi:cytochrome P450 [Streptomyces phaeochromogenes]|uniref:cytochrome P450 n=1 Tax=Streptomyces phaeochromogenes TaxID=1923 RepID=UPI0036CD5126
MTDAGPPYDFPFLPVHALEVEPILSQLRQEEPLTRVRLPYGGEAWLVTRYKEVRAVLADPRFSRLQATDRDVPRRQELQPPPEGIMYMDPPEHTRIRRLVAKVFTARRVEALRPRVQELTSGMVEQMAAHGPPADLVEFVSLPLPTAVICELLGVPFDDRHTFREHVDAMMAAHTFSHVEYLKHMRWLRDYFAELIARRRREPTDDLLGALVRARDDEDRLSETELVMLASVLLVGGQDTTASEITNALYTLLRHPDQLKRLYADRSLLPSAVDELLRFVPLASGHHMAFIATEDIDLCGTTVKKGEPVFTHPQSANKDPDQFPDPERLDLARDPNPHLSLGHGMHHCLGAPLARLEMQIAIGTLLDRFPRLELAIDEENIPWRDSLLLRGPTALPLSW